MTKGKAETPKILTKKAWMLWGVSEGIILLDDGIYKTQSEARGWCDADMIPCRVEVRYAKPRISKEEQAK